MTELQILRRALKDYNADDNRTAAELSLSMITLARKFAQQMNRNADNPDDTVQAGQINAALAIQDLLHVVIRDYKRRHPDVMKQLYHRLVATLSQKKLHALFLEYTKLFFIRDRNFEPGKDSSDKQISDVRENPEQLLEDLIVVWCLNSNPALKPARKLFDVSPLAEKTYYQEAIREVQNYFKETAADDNLVEILLEPIRQAPESLEEQLNFIAEKWIPGDSVHTQRALTSIDILREENRVRMPGPGPAPVPEYPQTTVSEPEKFSEDLDWMPNLVLIAKNVYVWLDQLSRKYEKLITRLDQIPDAELAMLAGWGITGIWLIGVWERSPASAKIKKLCGNPHAVASAYSLHSYTISEDLGGESALKNLKTRAARFGIRLGSDMVPNHTGIDSDWISEHPEWFISTEQCPFPGYTFKGPDLSSDPDIEIRIEDHYYDRTDAAVVFQRKDVISGEIRYIYHGNDGTDMPWNDTAQLNYLRSDVREAVIRTIIRTADLFPIIRFDAAMTLAKQHYQRLWFPEPGKGGAIPSRAAFSMSRNAFDELFPGEFWREVVDRCAEEVPNTLLLAEAFWLMEGYFVRTLGMHRVYNSAFMNMLRDEENEKYHMVMRNTLAFDPRILKRFVNFMNNPDEKTALEQFDKGDKYFGICVMLATLPGLPMFGHGQIEGFREKYGMEYRTALLQETPDEYMLQRHEAEIFPLLRNRSLFAEIDHFLLYDFETSAGDVNFDVFAYSNRKKDSAALVVYHNRYAETRGFVLYAADYSVPQSSDAQGIIQRKHLLEGLNIKPKENGFLVFKDKISGTYFIRRTDMLREKGLFLDLGKYACYVFMEFRQVEDDPDGLYAKLEKALEGKGVPDIDQALRTIRFQPILEPFSGLFEDPEIFPEKNFARFVSALRTFTSVRDAARYTAMIRKDRELIFRTFMQILPAPDTDATDQDTQDCFQKFVAATGETVCFVVLTAWIFTHRLNRLIAIPDLQNRDIIREWMLHTVINARLQNSCSVDSLAADLTELVPLLSDIEFSEIGHSLSGFLRFLVESIQNPDVQRFIQVNRFEEILWFNRERFQQFIRWVGLIKLLYSQNTEPELFKQSQDICHWIGIILKAAELAEFKLENFSRALLKMPGFQSFEEKPERK